MIMLANKICIETNYFCALHELWNIIIELSILCFMFYLTGKDVIVLMDL